MPAHAAPVALFPVEVFFHLRRLLLDLLAHGLKPAYWVGPADKQAGDGDQHQPAHNLGVEVLRPQEDEDQHAQFNDEVRGGEYEPHGAYEVGPVTTSDRPAASAANEQDEYAVPKIVERDTLFASGAPIYFVRRALGTNDWIMALMVYPSTKALFEKKPTVVFAALPYQAHMEEFIREDVLDPDWVPATLRDLRGRYLE